MKRSLKNPFLVGVVILISLISYIVFSKLDGQLRIVLILMIFILTLLFTIFVIMSPRLAGLFQNKKDLPDENLEKLIFSSSPTNRTPIKYSIDKNDPKLRKLRNEFKLDEIVKAAKNDFEIVQLIQSWVHSKWEHHGHNKPKKNDAYYILKKAEEGERFRCVEYSHVTLECLQALGLIVRIVKIWTKDIADVNSGGAHVVNEVYLREFDKWAFIDPQFDIIVTENGLPLNTVEFQNALVENRNIKIINHSENVSESDYTSWIRPYLYYITVSLNKGDVSLLDIVLGTKKNMTLVPQNAPEPKNFQGLFTINNSIFTNALKDIYPTKLN